MNAIIKTGAVCCALAVLAACRHGIEIVGQGNVTSASGARNCSRNAAPCRFEIEGAYNETYTATPAAGWLHDAWERCQEPTGNRCRFSIGADVTSDFPDADVPGAVARFRRPIEPLFRNASGAFVLPQGGATEQLAWLLGELRQPTTSINEIQAHFSPEFLQNVSPSSVQASIDQMRAAVSDPEISDLVTATPVFTRAVVQNRGANTNGLFVSVNASYASGGLITGLQFRTGFPRGGSNVASADAGLNLQQLGAKFAGLASNTSMLVASIDNDRCRPLFNQAAATPRPTGSIFKLWVLGALTEEIRAGRIASTQMVPLSADHLVPAGARINDTPLGTQFSISELANLMIGISDNTATDHLHALVGRDRIEAILQPFGNKNRDLLTPFLSTNEQFHIFWSLAPALATSYAEGTEEEQRSILENSIEPLGPVTEFARNNQDALFNSSWAASALDVCQAYAGLRRFDNRSAAFDVMDQAAGADAVLLSTRSRWDRVWAKGGSLANAQGNYVFTLSWLFESDDRGAYVVVLMASNPDGSPVDSAPAFSIAARAEQIVFNR